MSDEPAVVWSEAAVLIVDDEPDVCWALTRILRESDIVAVTATSGDQALRLTARQRFRLAFIDAKLPDADGLDLARRIRAVDRRVHIVLVSGYFYEDDRAVLEAAASGVINGFVAKPFVHAEVRRIALGALTP